MLYLTAYLFRLYNVLLEYVIPTQYFSGNTLPFTVTPLPPARRHPSTTDCSLYRKIIISCSQTKDSILTGSWLFWLTIYSLIKITNIVRVKNEKNVWYKDHKGFKRDIDVDFGIILPVFLMSTWNTIYSYLIDPVLFKCIMNATDGQKVL